ncbi:Acylpyruvase fahd1, mitochondrial [Cichlidogyrus casuarinus]|uniref:oxaloacetate tautomerase n=1 Tax=Cichlidogyrus casuarinus TaxID=1844966 RepID=A0ABD2PV16_9PLAT
MNSCYKSCRKIVAVARNYVAHARELGNEVPTEPIVFLKPSTSIITVGQSIKMPPGSKLLNHEVELCLVIGKSISNASPDQIKDCISGYTVALDMTERDLQSDAISKGYPWSIAKGFDTSCCLGPLMDINSLPADMLLPKEKRKNSEDLNLDLWLKVNGVERQRASTSLMVHSPADLIAFVSKYMTLEAGDLILTGTPAGIGPCEIGDTIHAGMGQNCEVVFKIV